jgi:hypothetical protein
MSLNFRRATAAFLAVVATAILTVLPAAQASADDGYVSAYSTDYNGWAGAQISFGEKSVTWDPVRINDRVCGDNRFVTVQYMVRFQGASAFTQVDSVAISEGQCNTGPVFERSTHIGSVKVDDAGIRVCYNGYRNCSAITWRDNANVPG